MQMRHDEDATPTHRWSPDTRIVRASISSETVPGKWKSVKRSARGKISRMASRTFSPPLIPVSQSWTTATLRWDRDDSGAGESERPAPSAPFGRFSRRDLIVGRGGIRFVGIAFARRRGERVFVLARTVATDEIVPEVLIRSDFAKAIRADVLSGSGRELGRDVIVVHRRLF